MLLERKIVPSGRIGILFQRHPCHVTFLAPRDDAGVIVGVPRWQLGELIYRVFGFLYEPIHRLAGPVVAEPVLDVVELNGGVSREAHTPVTWPFRGEHFTVPVFPAGRPDNMAAFNLHYFPTAAGAGAASLHPRSFLPTAAPLRIFGFSEAIHGVSMVKSLKILQIIVIVLEAGILSRRENLGGFLAPLAIQIHYNLQKLFLFFTSDLGS
nr:hypothetical protein KK1_022532 [Ipomoea trifida]